MFRLHQIHPEGGDCTAPYDVELNGEYNEPDYIFDPCWVIEPDGRIWLREVSLICNPNKTMKVEEASNDSDRQDS